MRTIRDNFVSAMALRPNTAAAAVFALLVAAGFGWHVAARAAEPASPALKADPHVLRFTPGMPQNALAGRPDSDFVELSDGRRLRVGDVRRLKQAAQRMRAADKPLPPALTVKPASSGKPVGNADELAAALKLPDSATLQLPSGRRVTVGQIKFFRPQIEKRLGRPLVTTGKRTGPAIKVGANADWKSLLQKPDTTVLEAPDGTRITVGELKQSLAKATPKAGARQRR
ncbi:MAG TPA: hypothetical protein VGA00_08835 [Acidiferrobacterales bacterium]